MKKNILISLLWISIIVSLFISCANDGGLLVGTWLANDAGDRLIFRDDGTFVSETFNGSTWDEFMSGTYTYSETTHKLILTSNGVDMEQILIVNASHDTLGLALDAYLGGDPATLIGTWSSTQVIHSATPLSDTRTWVFTATTVTYSETTQIGSNPPSTDIASGSVTYDLAAGTFTVSSSTDTNNLSNGTYNFLVLGSGVVLPDANDREITYYIKQ